LIQESIIFWVINFETSSEGLLTVKKEKEVERENNFFSKKRWTILMDTSTSFNNMPRGGVQAHVTGHLLIITATFDLLC
jgi:hypothetical protein